MSVTKMQTHMQICTRVLYNNSARKFHMSYRPSQCYLMQDMWIFDTCNTFIFFTIPYNEQD